MTDAEKAAAVTGLPGVVVVGGREWVLPPPSAADAARVYRLMWDLARKDCVNPLAFVNATAADLSPAVFQVAVREALAMGSGGGPAPTDDAVLRAYDSLDGVRLRFWYFARKLDEKVTQAVVKTWITDENVYDVMDALAKAQGLRDLDPKGTPGSGTGSSPPSPGTS